MMSKKALEKICRIKGVKPDKARFSWICEDFKMIGEYTTRVSTPVYKMLKRSLPGPYTFILEASKSVPRHYQTRKKTIGIRMVDSPIVMEIVRELGNPIMSTSIYSEDEILEYETDPEEIENRFGHQVDFVIDGGPGNNIPSTVIDASDDLDVQVIREGLGSLDILV